MNKRLEFFIPSPNELHELEKVKIELDTIYRKNTDMKEFDKLIKQVEKVIREMPEYKKWASIRAEAHDKCQLCEIPFEETGLKKHVHHTPLTLYEIVVGEVEEMLRGGNRIDTLELVDRVIEKHLSGEVMSVVVCPCCHKRCHYEKKEYGNEVTLENKLRELEEGSG